MCVVLCVCVCVLTGFRVVTGYTERERESIFSFPRHIYLGWIHISAVFYERSSVCVCVTRAFQSYNILYKYQIVLDVNVKTRRTSCYVSFYHSTFIISVFSAFCSRIIRLRLPSSSPSAGSCYVSKCSLVDAWAWKCYFCFERKCARMKQMMMVVAMMNVKYFLVKRDWAQDATISKRRRRRRPFMLTLCVRQIEIANWISVDVVAVVGFSFSYFEKSKYRKKANSTESKEL